jgi:hypothetical protein
MLNIYKKNILLSGYTCYRAKVIKSIIAISLSIALLSFQSGCASLPYQIPPPLAEQERSRLGTIGIVSADFIPEPKLFTYSRGRVRGAAEGMVFKPSTGVPPIFFPSRSASSGMASGESAAAGAALFIGIGIIFLIGSEIYRAATAIPAEKVKEIESDLKKALIELMMQESFKEKFFQTAREQSAFNLVLVEGGGPKTPEEILNYGNLKEKGIDTVIELSILSISFEGQGGKDPLLSLLLDARTRVLSVSGGTVLYENMLEYRSARRKFTEWISDEGKLFLEELDKGYGKLSEKIVEELFLRYEFTTGKASGEKATHVVSEKGEVIR